MSAGQGDIRYRDGLFGADPRIMDRKFAAGLLEQRDDILCRRESAIAGVVLECDAQHRNSAGLDCLALIGEQLLRAARRCRPASCR